MAGIAGTGDHPMRNLAVISALVLAFNISVARADVIEDLSFKGTATCKNINVPGQTCTPGTTGPLTGTYKLDVTTQMIIGNWLFASPFGSFASSDPGASATVFDGVVNNGINYDVAEFAEQTNNPVFLEVLGFGFTGPNALLELGAISTPVPVEVVISGMCLNVPNSQVPGCLPDVDITGVTAPVPEPGSLPLLASALLGAAGLVRCRLR